MPDPGQLDDPPVLLLLLEAALSDEEPAPLRGLPADRWASCRCLHFRINHPDGGACVTTLGCDCQAFVLGPSLGLKPDAAADLFERRRPHSAA